MIRPVNGHLLIEPLKHDSFISSDKGTYEEVGIVVGLPETIYDSTMVARLGDRVYFDSFLAAKYPTGKGDEHFWLVKWEDVRAIEKNEGN